jgi:serine/threonine-protein kinase 24/25/MST4
MFFSDSFTLAQRPTVKDLLKHKFIAKAKKNSYLMELIERYRKWKEGGGKDDSDDDSDSDKFVF